VRRDDLAARRHAATVRAEREQRSHGLARRHGLGEEDRDARHPDRNSGNSILAMSGEESLAQVNREIATRRSEPGPRRLRDLPLQHAHDGPDLVLCGADHPDDVRMANYADNLIVASRCTWSGRCRCAWRCARSWVVGFLILAAR